MKLFLLVWTSAAGLSTALFAENVKGMEDVQRLYADTNYSAVVNRLQGATDAPSLRLLGRGYLMMNDLKRASDTLEKAVGADPKNSEGYLWLGRAYGMRAQNAMAISAASLAIKTRENFERAYALDARNWDAAGDLFEFYLQAPVFMGGGLDKASRMADALVVHDAAEGAVAHARVAERRKDFQTAEKQFRTAIQIAPDQAARHVDLAQFFAHRGRFAESDAEFAQAFQSSPNSAKIMYARADTLIQTNRNLPEAKQLLTRYLALKLTPDDPPRQDAEKLLRKVSGS